MNPRNTFFLVVLAAGLFAFIFFFERHRNLGPPPPVKLMPGLDIAAITNIQIQLRGQEEIRAERTTNGTWQLTRPILYPAQGFAIDTLLKALQQLTAQGHISAEELKGKRNVDADYGFEPALASIVVVQQGNDQTLKLGNLTAPGDQIYAHVVGSEGVDIVGKDIFQYIPRQTADWRDTVFLNLQGRVFDKVTVTNGAKTFTLQSDGTNSSWHILPHERMNLSLLKDLFDKLQALRVARFETDKTNAELELYGLQPPELQLDFDQGTNHLLTLQFGKSPTNAPGLIYARRDDQNSVVLVAKSLVEGWRAEKMQFRDRSLAGMYTWLPDEIEVTGRANFSLRRETNDSWRVMPPFDFPADTNLVKMLITKLARLSVFPTNGPVAVKDIVPPSEWTNFGLAPPVWKYVLKDNVASGASNVVMAELDFGAVTNDTVFARRPEEPSLYAVALADFQKLPTSGMQLHERRIWDFTEDQVARVIIRQDGRPMELIHRAANVWALGTGSQGVFEPLAVEVGAQELGALAAEDFVERGDEKKAAYGFTDKSLQITALVQKNGQLEMLTVELGGWSPSGLRYGLVDLGGQKWIFEFPSVVYDRLMFCFSIHEETARPAPANAPAGKTGTNAPAK